MEKKEFWRDEQMDLVITTIIDLFKNIEGVELVRLNGLTKYLNNISNKNISIEDIKIIINKLYDNKIINYTCIYKCPHCNEISFIIKEEENKKVKLCDTCNTLYELINNITIFKSERNV